MKNIFNLQLFAEGENNLGVADPDMARSNVETTGTADSNVTTNETNNHVADGNGNDGQVVDREQEYSKFKEDYKDLFQKDFDKSFNKRFKDHKESQAELEELRNFKSSIAERYGVDGSNLKELSNALLYDDRFYEEKSIETGIPVESLKKMDMLERENGLYKEREQQKEQEQEANKQVADWIRQSDELQKDFPNFDLQAESENKEFMDLLHNGISVATAYKVIHNDEILNGAIQYTADTVHQKVAQDIQARGLRPSETSTTTGNVVPNTDYTKMTSKQRDEIAQNILNGTHKW